MIGVWVTRPDPGGARTCRAIRDAGYEAVHAPVLEVRLRLLREPVESGAPGLVVFVSGNAVDGFIHNVEAGRLDVSPATAAAVVGERTAARLAGRGWTGPVTGPAPAALSLLEILARRPPGTWPRVWIPAGDRPGSARAVFPRFFAERGERASVLEVYATADRDLTPHERERLGSVDPGAVVYHSPSAADSVARMCGEAAPDTAGSAVAAWWREGVPVAVGPTTARRLAVLGADGVRTAAEPSDADVVACLHDLFSRSGS
jgi:uroporphyrinogen-III synthase